MRRQEVEAVAAQLAEEILADYPELELVDVEYCKQGPEWILRVYIDKDGGVTLDDCEKVSKPLSRRLDEVDPIPGSYSLEVSSPGLERPLKKDSDFERFAGRLVHISTYAPYEGRKEWEGRLLGLQNSAVVIEAKTGIIKIPKDRVAKARLAIEV